MIEQGLTASAASVHVHFGASGPCRSSGDIWTPAGDPFEAAAVPVSFTLPVVLPASNEVFRFDQNHEIVLINRTTVTVKLAYALPSDGRKSKRNCRPSCALSSSR